MQLSGKTILVTGGTDGIGLQLIRQLKAKGATVITSGRNPERVAAAQSEGFEVIAADLSTHAGVDALLAGVAARAIDVLVNNAGVSSDHDFREGEPDLADNDASIFLNLNTPIHLITRLMPTLRSRPEAMIVNVTSGLAIAPRGGGPVYCATKAGLRSYTQALRFQLKGTGIHVLEALPPVVETKMTARLSSKKLAAADCAAAFVRAMENNADEANVGQVKLLKLVYSLSPALARKTMLRF
jgi:uncharacterized oxidoreductase